MLTAPPPPLARTPDEWADVVRSWGGRPFHARQLFRWLHSRGVLQPEDRKSTRLNSSHQIISYAVFCLKKKKTERQTLELDSTTSIPPITQPAQTRCTKLLEPAKASRGSMWFTICHA